MAESSRFWASLGIGDGDTGGYPQDEIYDFFRKVFISDQQASQGVLKNVDNELAASGVATPISVATGAAIVYGFFYENTAVVDLAVASPATGTTGGRVNLKVDWVAQTVRLEAVKNTDGNAAPPALTQTDGVEWQLPLYTFTITTLGVIALTDVRTYAAMSLEVVDEMIRDSAGLSVIGRSANSTGDVDDIVAAADYQVLRREGTAVEFGQVSEDGFANDAVTQDKVEEEAVDEARLIDDSVTIDKIAHGAVGTSKILDNAVNEDRIADGAVGNADIANLAVTENKFPNLGVQTADLDTPDGFVVAGTGGPVFHIPDFVEKFDDDALIWGARQGYDQFNWQNGYIDPGYGLPINWIPDGGYYYEDIKINAGVLVVDFAAPEYTDEPELWVISFWDTGQHFASWPPYPFPGADTAPLVAFLDIFDSTHHELGSIVIKGSTYGHYALDPIGFWTWISGITTTGHIYIHWVAIGMAAFQPPNYDEPY